MKNKAPKKVSFYMLGRRESDPRCKDQNLVPYRLATPQNKVFLLIYTRTRLKSRPLNINRPDYWQNINYLIYYMDVTESHQFLLFLELFLETSSLT